MQTESSILTVNSVVVKILENTHFPHFAYIFCKQNVSKIPCSTVTIPQLLVKVKSTELNSSVAEDFCKTVKEESPDSLTGIFYGYMLECQNAAYTGWLV